MSRYPFHNTSDTGRSVGSDVSATSGASSWLLEAKVLAPALPVAYVSRNSLLQHLDGLLERRLTVLQAPAGFGKTTALAEIVHDRKKQGVVVGWMALDADDMPHLFGSYLAYSFERAGLELGPLSAHDAWASSEAVHQMGMLARAIEQHEAPCLLVLDEVDNLPSRTVQLVDLLVRRAPRNLHIALACRTNPGLELSRYVLDGGALVLGAEALRFSRADIARFLGGAVSRGELSAIEERTAGWPVALRVHRNARGAARVGLLSADAAQLTEGYIGMSVLRGLSPEDRDCLFDLSVFDWVDADLVDEVLGSSDARLRVVSLSTLNGLLPSVDPDGVVRRLHPLVRNYCLKQLAVENPDRKRSLHRRIALQLARRGQLTPSWRHASEAGDSRLAGELIERHGLFRLWLREGVARLISAGRFLTAEIVERYPRLALLQCVTLRLSARQSEAVARFEAMAQKTDGFTRDREGGDPEALAVDGMFTRVALLRSCQQVRPGDLDSWVSARDAGGVVVDDDRRRTFACARHALLCVASYERARFEECREHGQRAQALGTEDTRFGDVFVNTCLGMAAMAQGRVQEARTRYGRARQVARKFFASDPCITLSADVLTIELDIEENREKAIQQRTLKNLTKLRDVWVETYATAIAVSAELMLRQYDNQAVVKHLSTAADEARAIGVENLSCHVSALLAYYLVEVGSPDAAARVWRDEELPCGVAELLDLERRPWSAMEALACARIRLLGEQAQYAAAEELACALCAVAAERGLTRTLLRGLALSMVVSHRARQWDRALTHLADFLRAVRGVGYTRPLVRHRAVSRDVLRRLLATNPDDALRTEAESMLASLGDPVAGDGDFFSQREIEVLAEAARGLRSKEIGVRLGISDQGVRYHLKNIYRKAGVSRRMDAVEYARSLRILS